MLVKIGFLGDIVKEYLVHGDADLEDILVADGLDHEEIMEEYDIDIVGKDGVHIDEHECDSGYSASDYPLEDGCAVIIKSVDNDRDNRDCNDSDFREGWYSANTGNRIDFLWYDEDDEVFYNARNDEEYVESELNDIEKE